MEKCFVCPFNCGVDRIKQLGVCRAPNQIEVAHYQIHQWEEPCISGLPRRIRQLAEKAGLPRRQAGQKTKRGSGTIFFSHCNLHCVFCQNYQISQLEHGKIISEEQLFAICSELKKQGAYNINLVSPTPYSAYLKNFLTKYKDKIGLPIVWNSNGYEKTKTIKSLAGLVDVWLPDLKYYDDKLAQKYSGAKNYFKFASAAILEMKKLAPKDIFSAQGRSASGGDSDGLITQGLVIRHLVLPNHADDSLKILNWIRNNLGPNTYLSLMSQYYPIFKAADSPEINRKLKSNEYQILLDWLLKNNFNNVFIQDPSSADRSFTPKFEEFSPPI